MSEEKPFDPVRNSEWRSRLHFLVDLIFAASMTILMLGIKIPDLNIEASTEEILEFLGEQLPIMWLYFVTFFVIAVYWIKHLEHFSYVRRVNQGFIWLQLFFLVFLVLFPAWNAYMTIFPDVYQVKIIYSINMFFIGFFAFLSWRYATKNHRLVDEELDQKVIDTLRKQAITEPVLAIVAIFAGLIEPVLWDLTFILVPISFALRKKIGSLPLVQKIGRFFKR